MSRRIQIVLLVALLGLFGYEVYRNIVPVSGSEDASLPSVQFAPLKVKDPALRLNMLNQLKQFQYHGSQRNIFSAAPPPPPVQAAARTRAMEHPGPSGPPPLVVPAKFFGYVTDARTGRRRAFFSEGDNVYIVSVGDTLMGQFRLLEIGNSSVEVEQISSGRRTTLTMREPLP